MTAVIYATTKPPDPSRLYRYTRLDGDIYVRVTRHARLDIDEALYKARPFKGEVVLNSIELKD